MTSLFKAGGGLMSNFPDGADMSFLDYPIEHEDARNFCLECEEWGEGVCFHYLTVAVWRCPNCGTDKDVYYEDEEED